MSRPRGSRKAGSVKERTKDSKRGLKDRIPDFQEPGAPGFRHTARSLFLDTIQQLVPEVVDELAGDPYTYYLPLRQLGVDHGQGVHGLQSWADLMECETGDPNVPRLQQSLRAWAERWHLTSPWCLDVAVMTLHVWEYPGYKGLGWEDDRWVGDWSKEPPKGPDPTSVEARGFSMEGLGDTLHVLDDHERHFIFEHDGWHVQRESGSAFLRKIEQAFADQLAAYSKHISGLARVRGLVDVPEKRQLSAHCEWAVLFQVKELGWTDIAKQTPSKRRPEQGEEARSHTMTSGGILKAVTSFLELIELERREGASPGAPPKKAGGG